jgi:hypothetical protein
MLKKQKSNNKKIGSKIPFEEFLPKLFYISAGNKLKAPIELKSIDVLSDLTFFTTSEKIPAGPLHLGNFDNIKPGDTIIYILDGIKNKKLL